MKKDTGTVLLIVVIAVIIAAVVLIFWPQAAVSSETFGQCLTRQGVVMYGVDTCSNCEDQKALFGNDFQHVQYVNCEFQKNLCQNKGIRMYPVWTNNTDMLAGIQSFQSLAEFSGCPLSSS